MWEDRKRGNMCSRERMGFKRKAHAYPVFKISSSELRRSYSGDKVHALHAVFPVSIPGTVPGMILTQSQK